jgi:hypothetical protein
MTTTAKPNEGYCCLYIKKFPRSLRSHFKAYCGLREITMQDAIIAMIRSKLKESKPA